MDPTPPVPQRRDRGDGLPSSGPVARGGTDRIGDGDSAFRQTEEGRVGALRPRRPATRVVVGLTVSLLLVWGGVTFGVAWFARDLSFDFFGWPFSFWVGAQGALLVYCLIVWLYARTMNRHEAAVLAAPPEATPSEF
ncbi:hypothetical protein CDN98_21155 [Roseateles terrae]|uniref:Solute:sodium symporter small subunit n=1 Tax=Roseateles terrae TaxID=431060 RepID=A0ABR6GVZ6_9BURK|nr:putative solute:sodium symporter small subunit [Roseateles terrae]OWQ83987.1 hypothetical protein CDN98_21155 [Roseateles terrae]